MSKIVSKERPIVHSRKLLRDRELSELVMIFFNNRKNLAAIAREFSAHRQILRTILESNGDINCMSSKKGVCFGI